MVKNIPVEMDASRVCDAIAKIGYSPASALMDIIDNSITADATEIIIEIDADTDKTFATKNNVMAYRIIDNGKGMNDDEILNALKLGARDEYESNSLSKYGMGLKSAGFSLGTRIQLVSKKNGIHSAVSYVDKEEIRNAGAYVVSRPELDEMATKEYGSKIAQFDSGTIIEINGCQNVKQDSAQRTVDKLQDQLGVVYYAFLTQSQEEVSMTLRCTGKPDVRITPHDILFTDIAKTGFDQDSYDYKSPYKVLSEEVMLKDQGVDAPMMLEAVIFPRDEMKRWEKFTDEEREQIKRYNVGLKNSGFFIYRNKRLIQWGESLGISKKDHLGFRARITLNTAHDDAFHVDVSKQRMAIPEDILAKIEQLTRIPLRSAKDAIEMCTALLKKPEGGKGSTYNHKNQDLSEEELEEITGEENIKAVRERKKLLVTETEEQEKIEEANKPEYPEADQVVEQIPIFERVRYSDTVQASSVWEAAYDSIDGTYVRINRNHSFYNTVLARMGDGDEACQAMEAIFWASAAAQNATFSNSTDADESTIKKVLDMFKKYFANRLDEWCSKNQDLYDND